MNWLKPFLTRLNATDPMLWTGTVTQLTGLLVESRGPAAAVGDFCEVQTRTGRSIRTQVIGFRNQRLLSMPLEETDGLELGDRIVAKQEDALVPVGPGLLGRVLDGFGKPLDGGPPIEREALYPLYAPPPGPMDREPIEERLETGIRVIDSLLACGKGQRIGIFGGSGVGKSTLIGAMARHNSAEVSVIALIGERNREVRDFIEHELAADGLARSVVVTATSERPAPLRVRAGFMALAIAEYFRDQGKDVLLVMDSVTRLAMAQREIGLAAGEPPAQKGYTPSVFQLLPRICERAGRFRRGSITGFFSVLVEGDDMNEPIADAVRGILDGHLVLSRELGLAGHYPAIDVLQSVSRLAGRVSTPEERLAAQRFREMLGLLRQSQDLINLGAYVSGSNPKLDAALRLRPQLDQFLKQDAREVSRTEETVRQMSALMLNAV